MRLAPICAIAFVAASGCSQRQTASVSDLHVAAAANLTRVLQTLTADFGKQSGIRVVPSYGATAQLEQQIENGAPFDVFLAADVTHVDQLVKTGFALPESRTLYARGQLALWAPRRPDLRSIDELADPKIMGIIVAKPELAPYGEAAIESIKNMGLWDRVEKKIVYAPSILAAKQFVDTGNGDAAFTALSLILDQPGNYFLIDEKLHKPIDQALCILKNTRNAAAAKSFTSFIASSAGRDIFRRFGYGQP